MAGSGRHVCCLGLLLGFLAAAEAYPFLYASRWVRIHLLTLAALAAVSPWCPPAVTRRALPALTCRGAPSTHHARSPPRCARRRRRARPTLRRPTWAAAAAGTWRPRRTRECSPRPSRMGRAAAVHRRAVQAPPARAPCGMTRARPRAPEPGRRAAAGRRWRRLHAPRLATRRPCAARAHARRHAPLPLRLPPARARKPLTAHPLYLPHHLLPRSAKFQLSVGGRATAKLCPGTSHVIRVTTSTPRYGLLTATAGEFAEGDPWEWWVARPRGRGNGQRAAPGSGGRVGGPWELRGRADGAPERGSRLGGRARAAVAASTPGAGGRYALRRRRPTRAPCSLFRRPPSSSSLGPAPIACRSAAANPHCHTRSHTAHPSPVSPAVPSPISRPQPEPCAT